MLTNKTPLTYKSCRESPVELRRISSRNLVFLKESLIASLKFRYKYDDLIL